MNICRTARKIWSDIGPVFIGLGIALTIIGSFIGVIWFAILYTRIFVILLLVLSAGFATAGCAIVARHYWDHLKVQWIKASEEVAASDPSKEIEMGLIVQKESTQK